MKKKLPFRAWYYFRVGYVQYFTFILALANMFTITYYLVITHDPSLKIVFPSFSAYVVISTLIGIPLLVLVGFVHLKRSHAFTSEMDISVESNPYNYKLYPGILRECMAPLYLELLILGRKSLSDEKMTEEEIEKLEILQKKLDFISQGGSLQTLNAKNKTL
ncbi:MAG: hypothetical protein KGH89_02660 [Thaumarchaeota archaeon]|nr:hypothetical protein [Nitrososphaerota archaeon]